MCESGELYVVDLGDLIPGLERRALGGGGVRVDLVDKDVFLKIKVACKIFIFLFVEYITTRGPRWSDLRQLYKKFQFYKMLNFITIYSYKQK